MSLVFHRQAGDAPVPVVRHGLGTYLAFAFSLLSVLVTAVLVLVSEHIASEQVRSSIGGNLAELANQTTSRLDRAMYERYREVGLLSQRIPAADMATVRAEVASLQRTYPNYAWIGLVDPAGTVLAATDNLLAGQNVSARPWFAAAREGGAYVGDMHPAELLAGLLPHAESEPMRFVDIAYPVGRAGQASPPVLAVHLSWQWARDIEKAIFGALTPGHEVEPLIVSRQGIVLLGPKAMQERPLVVDSLVAADRGNGYTVERWPDGKEYLVGYSHARGYLSYPGLGWRVLVRQDLDTAFAPVRQLQHHLMAWGLGVALLFSLLGWLAARLVTRPLIHLAADARELEAGGRLRHVQSEPYREVAQLGGALRSMVRNVQQKEAALRDLNASLERRVEERTAALRETFEHVRESERRIQTILESAPDPFIAVDFGGCVTDWNSRAEALFGWKRDEMVGRPLVQVLVPERFRASFEKALRTLAATGRVPQPDVPIERIVVDRAGREIEIEMRVGIVNSGKVQLLCAFMHDISQRKEVERLKTEFVSTVSHELRTPLTSVYGSLRLLASGVAGQLSTQGRQLLEMSTRSCERLIRLINDVLDVERIASGRFSLRAEPLELRGLVTRAMDDTRGYADGLGVRLLLDEASVAQVQVVADGDRVTQVVVNLLSNAAKFSPRGDEVRVTVETGDGRARVTVVDHGPGIPADFRARIFERFAQADASDRREKGGTGLGLNICRSIVEAHGGTIGFDTEPGVRTAFWFELPLQTSAA
ncbi:ATP-binding protein [Ramlibacter sp. MMS24-I3-19]|uniref:ATP-binding protein n=1 Tax=Ramlibacter sp. MMS24-I3-19 TaxID=3416606 RepID=UPI003D05F13D